MSKFIGLIEKGLDVHIICSAFERQNLKSYPKLAPHISRIHALWPQKRSIGIFLLPALFMVSLLAGFDKTIKFFSEGISIAQLKRFYQDAPIMFLHPNIIHFEFGALAVGREYLKSFLGCKVVVSFRGYDLNFSGLENPHYYDEVWKNVDSVHCLGKDLWRRAQQRGCPPDKPHYLIPPAVDTGFFKRDRSNTVIASPERERQFDFQNQITSLALPPRHDVVRILSVGRLEWKKGYEFSLQAIKQLKNQGLAVEYHIIGSGQYLEAIAFCRHQLDLENEVKLLGSKNAEEIRSEMQWANIFLHAAVSEGFCNAVLEAQAMELPIVTSDADGLSENVEDAVTGFVVSRRDTKTMTDKIQLLAKDPQLRAKMSKAGRERAVSVFKFTHQIESFQQMYESLS